MPSSGKPLHMHVVGLSMYIEAFIFFKIAFLCCMSNLFCNLKMLKIAIDAVKGKLLLRKVKALLYTWTFVPNPMGCYQYSIYSVH